MKNKKAKKKKNKGPRPNYTTVCWYSGIIFHSNRSTAKFLPGGCRQLYHKDGPQINPMTFDIYGQFINADERLGSFYSDHEPWIDGWSVHQPVAVLWDQYDYKGPKPNGDELMVVGSYVMRRIENLSNRYSVDFCVKPITMLTVKERATMTFIKGEIIVFEPHDYVSPEILAEYGVIETKTVEEQQREKEERRLPIEKFMFKGIPLKDFQKKEVPPVHPTQLQAMADFVKSFYKLPFFGKPVKSNQTTKQADN